MKTAVLQFFPAKAVRAGQFIILVEAILRGWSYLVTPSGAIVSMTSAERTAPLWVWGCLFLVPAVVAIGFEIFKLKPWRMKNRKAIFVNPLENWVTPQARYVHMFFALALTVLGFSSWAGIIERVPFYGFYAPIDTWIIAYAHFVFTIKGHRLGVVTVDMDLK